MIRMHTVHGEKRKQDIIIFLLSQDAANINLKHSSPSVIYIFDRLFLCILAKATILLQKLFVFLSLNHHNYSSLPLKIVKSITYINHLYIHICVFHTFVLLPLTATLLS